MTDGGLSNDNGFRENGGFDPDMNYVDDYLKKALAHFKECNISHAAIAIGLTDALVKCVPGNPYEKFPDESGIWSGLYSLWPAESHIQNRVKVYTKALERIQKNRPLP
jgi:hypothetical protein